MPTEGLMTVEDLANYLNVTTKTVYRMLEKRSIPATRVGHQWRFSRDSIDTWLKQSYLKKTAKILVMDNDKTVCSLFKDTLEKKGHIVTIVDSSSAGLGLVQSQDFDLVFLNFKMPEMNGVELIRQIKSAKPKLPVTIITEYPDSELMAKALSHGPLSIMNKPLSGSDILAAVDNYLRFNMCPG